MLAAGRSHDFHLQVEEQSACTTGGDPGGDESHLPKVEIVDFPPDRQHLAVAVGFEVPDLAAGLVPNAVDDAPRWPRWRRWPVPDRSRVV